ncbi:hypothetical protein ACQ86N_17535 [Puia sp. P3]|uniref:hypothetical protein n=1 Tax=Puia sp. P3 TaxID=3423952 RepID=UPI003D679CE6
MKHLVLNLLTLLLVGAAYANPDPAPATAAKTASTVSANAGTVRFQFTNARAKDSVLIIFDKYNRTGAGVVYRYLPRTAPMELRSLPFPQASIM